MGTIIGNDLSQWRSRNLDPFHALKDTAPAGAKSASVEAIARHCDVVFAMVFDDAAVRSMFQQYLKVDGLSHSGVDSSACTSQLLLQASK